MNNNDDTDDYSRAKVYKVWSPNCDKVYYGSTVNTLAERMCMHRSTHNATTSKQIIDAGDADIKLVEDFPCMNKYELEDREAEVMRADWDGCVNVMVPGAVRRAGGEKAWGKEYRKVNAVKISARKKKYNEKNAEKIRAQRKEYWKVYAETIGAQKNEQCLCECGGKYTNRNKARHFKTKRHQNHAAPAQASKTGDSGASSSAESLADQSGDHAY